MPRPRSNSQPYSLTETVLPAPRIPHAREVIVNATADILFDRLAADMVAQAMECVRRFGDFHLALSGGSTPEPLYERLMYDPNFRALPWRRTHLWIVDERMVPFDDSKSNYRMIYETIVQHADIPQEQVHPIKPLGENADVEYEQELREQLMWREKGQDRLDFVLLGVGGDGHTASIFPASEAVKESKRFVRITRGGETPPPGRVTMTFPLINGARFIAVLACGASKQDAIARLVEDAETVETLPIKGVRPLSGELHFYLDAEAAGAA